MTRYCTGCGRPATDCEGACPATSTLEPSRFCPECGRRLSVQVFPGHVVARCRDHGQVADADQ